MIDGKSITVRLATGFGGFMPSHSLAPVTAPRLGRDKVGIRAIGLVSYGLDFKLPVLRS